MHKPYFLSCDHLTLISTTSHWSGVSGISFTLKPGAFIVLQGKSGSGKSQLLRLLANEMPTSDVGLTYGDLAVKEGEDKPDNPLFINETDSVQLGIKVAKQLKLYAKKCDNFDTINAAVRYFNLEPLLSLKCAEISEGYRRRLLLTQLLLSQRRLWLLDDPFKGLDEEGASLVQALIQARIERDGCVIMSSQNPIANPNVAILNMDDFQTVSA